MLHHYGVIITLNLNWDIINSTVALRIMYVRVFNFSKISSDITIRELLQNDLLSNLVPGLGDVGNVAIIIREALALFTSHYGVKA